MRIDHIGYAVKKIDRAIKSFEMLGFAFEPVIDDMDRNVRIAFGNKENYRIELISPLDNTQSSPIDRYLVNTNGTPYHICYKSEQFEKDVDNYIKQGFKVVIEPKPAIAFGGKRVVFLMTIGFGIMEIVEI